LSEIIDAYFKSLFTFDKTDIYTIFGIFICVIYYIYKLNKEYKADTEFIQYEVIDNKAQWVYNSELYYADVVNNSIDMKTKRKMSI
jgi:cbb3-type cytochrome oxidase subunit 3